MRWEIVMPQRTAWAERYVGRTNAAHAQEIPNADLGRCAYREVVWSAIATTAEIVQEDRCARATSAARAVTTAIVGVGRVVVGVGAWM